MRKSRIKMFSKKETRIVAVSAVYLHDVSPLPYFSFLITGLPSRWKFSLHHYHLHNRPFHIRRPRRIEFLQRTSIVRLCARFSNRSGARSRTWFIEKKKAAQSTHAAIYNTERAISHINQRSDLRQHPEKNNRAIKLLKNFFCPRSSY